MRRLIQNNVDKTLNTQVARALATCAEKARSRNQCGCSCCVISVVHFLLATSGAPERERLIGATAIRPRITQGSSFLLPPPQGLWRQVATLGWRTQSRWD
jgi:hypothetical protein